MTNLAPRWCNILECWAVHMNSLKVLEVSHGAWGERELNAKIATIDFHDHTSRTLVREVLAETISQLLMQPTDPVRSCKQLLRLTTRLGYESTTTVPSRLERCLEANTVPAFFLIPALVCLTRLKTCFCM